MLKKYRYHFHQVLPNINCMRIFWKWEFYWRYCICWAIDFSINWLRTENRFLSKRIPTPYNAGANWYIWWCGSSSQVRTIIIPWLSDFLKNSYIHFSTFLYLVTCFLRVTVTFQCRSHSVSKILVTIPYLISEGRGNCSSLWPEHRRNRDSPETCFQI